MPAPLASSVVLGLFGNEQSIHVESLVTISSALEKVPNFRPNVHLELMII